MGTIGQFWSSLAITSKMWQCPLEKCPLAHHTGLHLPVTCLWAPQCGPRVQVPVLTTALQSRREVWPRSGYMTLPITVARVNQLWSLSENISLTEQASMPQGGLAGSLTWPASWGLH